MKKVTLFIGIFTYNLTLFANVELICKESDNWPIQVNFTDVTDIYKEVDPTLFYYKLELKKAAALEKFNYFILPESLKNIGYKAADSSQWKDAFIRPAMWYVSTCALIEIACMAVTFLKGPKYNNILDKIALATAFLLVCGAAIENCRHNKAEEIDLSCKFPIHGRRIIPMQKQCSIYGLYEYLGSAIHLDLERNNTAYTIISVDHQINSIEIDIKHLHDTEYKYGYQDTREIFPSFSPVDDNISANSYIISLIEK